MRGWGWWPRPQGDRVNPGAVQGAVIVSVVDAARSGQGGGRIETALAAGDPYDEDGCVYLDSQLLAAIHAGGDIGAERGLGSRDPNRLRYGGASRCVLDPARCY